MREVAWVVFDEIHYMRDKGNQAVTISVVCDIIVVCIHTNVIKDAN